MYQTAAILLVYSLVRDLFNETISTEHVYMESIGGVIVNDALERI
jgi:hypothetical protein